VSSRLVASDVCGATRTAPVRRGEIVEGRSIGSIFRESQVLTTGFWLTTLAPDSAPTALPAQESTDWRRPSTTHDLPSRRGAPESGPDGGSGLADAAPVPAIVEATCVP